MGIRGDADPSPGSMARPRDAPGRVPRRHEQAPGHGRSDARRSGVDPRRAEPRGLRRVRFPLAPIDGRREDPEGIPPARELRVADPDARVNQTFRTASARPSRATARCAPVAISLTAAWPAFLARSPSRTANWAPVAFAYTRL